MAKVHNRVVIQHTVSTTAQTLTDIGFSAAQIAGAIGIAITGNNNLRYLGNGEAPTATKGHVVQAGETQELRGPSVRDLQFIREGSDVIGTFELDTFVDV